LDGEDSALLYRLKHRDPAAEEELFHRYYRFCFRVALRILKNEDEAADQAQSALLRALIHIGDFEGRAQLGSWLTRIVINGCFMRLRRDQRWRMVEATDALGHAKLRTQSGQSPEAQYEDAEIRTLIRREMNRVPKPFRQVLVLRYLEDRPIEEIATITGVSVKAAKSRLHRARHELRSRLERHGIRQRTEAV